MASIVLALILQRGRMALWINSISFVLLIALSALPLGDLLLQPIELRYPANPDLDAVEGIIVLGGGESARASTFWSQMQLNEGVERYTAALALARLLIATLYCA